MRKCRICANDMYMTEIIDKEFGYTNTRHSYCFKCHPVLQEDITEEQGLMLTSDAGVLLPRGRNLYAMGIRRSCG